MHVDKSMCIAKHAGDILIVARRGGRPIFEMLIVHSKCRRPVEPKAHITGYLLLRPDTRAIQGPRGAVYISQLAPILLMQA